MTLIIRNCLEEPAISIICQFCDCGGVFAGSPPLRNLKVNEAQPIRISILHQDTMFLILSAPCMCVCVRVCTCVCVGACILLKE